ncbi:phage terminase large subunit [Candidatus Saccharibacteria bacterium]|nr:phage terminase large subunit [Candidatus Saccharibacteria bacterium]
MLNKDLLERLYTDRQVRTEVTANSHLYFFATYFSNYMEYEISDLHRELFSITEQDETPLAVVMAFRGSAKSTIITMSYPIWAIVGRQQKKFVVIASQTQYQARVHLTNIKRELESNELLANDLGPFTEQREEWGSTSLYIPKYNARITAISTEQSVRGIRHGAKRPDLIISDDVEDVQSVKTREGRQKTFDWYTGEIIPAGDTYTKRIVVGNLLHEDSLLMRLMSLIQRNEIDGTFTEWPIVRNGVSTWPGKFPDMAAVKKMERSVASRIAWEREYMLNLVTDDDQIISHDMIHYYDELPELLRGQYSRIIIGVDLAISENDKADFTAILVIYIRGSGENQRMYIQPNIVNKRMSFPATVEQLKAMSDFYRYPRLYIEQTAYQAAVVQQLTADGLDVAGVTPHSDKRSRLNMIADRIQRGTILFPRKGAEQLITQLVHFGVEKHDDLVDALTTAVLEFIRDDRRGGTVRIGTWEELFSGPNPFRRGRSSRSGRDYWSRRLDDWEEATSGAWD